MEKLVFFIEGMFLMYFGLSWLWLIFLYVCYFNKFEIKKDWYFLYIFYLEFLSNEKIILSESLEIKKGVEGVIMIKIFLNLIIKCYFFYGFLNC